MNVHAKKIGIIVFISLFLAGLTLAQSQAQPLQTRTSVKKSMLLNKIWLKVLCMNKWNDNRAANSAMVVLKENNQSGAVINDAKVSVNSRMLSFNAGIQEYMGDIGSFSQGQKVAIKIKTKDGRKITGYVQASYFVRITAPIPFTTFSISSPIPVTWKFSNNNIYLVVFKILRGETQLFSTDVNGSTYTINLGALGIKVPAADIIRARVISPWTSNYHFSGPTAGGSLGQFFTSATVSIKTKK